MEWPTNSSYDTITTSVYYRSAAGYPESGEDSTEYYLHVCPACFKDVLIPLLKKAGIIFNEQERDW
jgi:hypothetical protein